LRPFGRLDVLVVNNAGKGHPKTVRGGHIWKRWTRDRYQLRGVFATTQAALKHLKDGGRIIN